MARTLPFLLSIILAGSAFAQTQQAGTAVDTDAAFQELVDKCDDVDALMLRARIRLQLPRTTDEAASTAQKMLDEGFATCGGGDLEGAKVILAEALKIAEAGATENFGTEGTAEVETTTEPDPSSEPDPASEPDEAPKKSKWWKLW